MCEPSALHNGNLYCWEHIAGIEAHTLANLYQGIPEELRLPSAGALTTSISMVDDQELPQGDEQMAEASSDSDSSDSDFEELDISPEDTRLLLKLEQQLKENPNLYDSHVQVHLRRRCCRSHRCPNCLTARAAVHHHRHADLLATTTCAVH
jgi:hypothetical protein